MERFGKIENGVTLSLWRSLSYRNQSIDLQVKSMDWFLYDREIRHERVKLLTISARNLHIIGLTWF